MPSTLNSIYNAQRGLSLGQAAIDVINNNISNMNTKGYSKQRLEISQYTNMSPYQNPADAAQDGLGAVIDGVSRNRDAFVDTSYRKEITDLNYYQEYSEQSIQIETIMDELGETGLSNTLGDFYNSLSQLAANPNDYTIRNTVVQNAITLTTKFNDVYESLQKMRTDLVGDYTDANSIADSKLGVTLEDLNGKLASIADLNDKINVATAQGITPNSLLDQRDRLIDDISQYMPFNIKNEINNTVSVSLGSVQLVSGNRILGNFQLQAGDDDNPSVARIVSESGAPYSNNIASIVTSGKVGAMLQLGGNEPAQLNIRGIIESLNGLAGQFAAAINTQQLAGRYIVSAASPHELSDNLSNPFDGTPPGADPDPEALFVDSDASGTITAGNISLNATISGNPYLIAAANLTATINETGDGRNAQTMANIQDDNIIGPGGTTTQGFLTNLIGRLGTQSKNVQDNYDIKSTIVDQISQKRESITGVNLDEELADLIRFQKAYEASAKVMSTISSTLDTIINMI
jgi:flagellar hook-associated protein 1 FlgK